MKYRFDLYVRPPGSDCCVLLPKAGLMKSKRSEEADGGGTTLTICVLESKQKTESERRLPPPSHRRKSHSFEVLSRYWSLTRDDPFPLTYPSRPVNSLRPSACINSKTKNARNNTHQDAALARLRKSFGGGMLGGTSLAPTGKPPVPGQFDDATPAPSVTTYDEFGRPKLAGAGRSSGGGGGGGGSNGNGASAAATGRDRDGRGDNRDRWGVFFFFCRAGCLVEGRCVRYLMGGG